MKLRSLHIKNFKSIVDLTIEEPNRFTVFVGPNGSGKSNIFEAIEYRLFSYRFADKYKDIDSLFPNVYSFNPIVSKDFLLGKRPEIQIRFETFSIWPMGIATIRGSSNDEKDDFYDFPKDSNYHQFVDNHSEIFISNYNREKIGLKGENRLSSSCSNLEKVLKRILSDGTKREEIVEWLGLFIPGFENIEIISSDLSGTDTLVIYEKGTKKPFTKDLLSDGTFNILALLTAVYQSDEPQFLCIEEPENGLHPHVIRSLVDFFRAACEEKGHYIWLNTHSESLTRQLKQEEIIVVDKINSETKIKQFKGQEFYDLQMDEAWLTGALEGGLPF